MLAASPEPPHDRPEGRRKGSRRGAQRAVLDVAAYRWRWLSEATALALPDDVGGFVYRDVGESERFTLGSGD